VPQQRVICVGNDLCHDDGVAGAVGRALELHRDALGTVEIVHLAEFGLSSLDALLNVDHVVVVDALVSGHQPGTCRIIEDSGYTPSATCSIGHAVTLGSILELVARLSPDGHAPRVTVVGIEAENLEPFGSSLSPAVQTAVPVAVEMVCRELGVSLKTTA